MWPFKKKTQLRGRVDLRDAQPRGRSLARAPAKANVRIKVWRAIEKRWYSQEELGIKPEGKITHG